MTGSRDPSPRPAWHRHDRMTSRAGRTSDTTLSLKTALRPRANLPLTAHAQSARSHSQTPRCCFALHPCRCALVCDAACDAACRGREGGGRCTTPIPTAHASRARQELPIHRVHEHIVTVPLEIGDAERRVVQHHIHSGVPLVIRGALPPHKRTALLSSWCGFIARSDDPDTMYSEYSTNQGPQTDRTDGGSSHSRGKLSSKQKG